MLQLGNQINADQSSHKRQSSIRPTSLCLQPGIVARSLGRPAGTFAMSPPSSFIFAKST